MPHALPTVTIRRNDGSRAVINERDYDPEIHVLAGSPPDAETEGDKTPPFTAEHGGGGWYEITGPDGAVLEKVQGKDSAEARLKQLNA